MLKTIVISEISMIENSYVYVWLHKAVQVHMCNLSPGNAMMFVWKMWILIQDFLTERTPVM